MKHARRNVTGFWAAAALAAALALGGCERAGTVTIVPGEADAAPIPGDPVVARVDGTPIRQSDVERAAAARGAVPDGTPLERDDPAFETALEELVDQRLFALDAKRRQLDLEPEAQRRLQAAGERLLANYNVEQRVATAVEEPNLRALYDAQNALAGQVPEREIRRMEFADGTVARTALLRLSDGEDFAEVAGDLNSEVGSEPEWLREDALPEGLREAVFTAPIGERLPLTETAGGWHIVEVLDVRTPGADAFEDVRDDLARFLTLRTVDEALADLRAEAEVEMIEESPVAAPATAAPQPTDAEPTP